MKRIAKRKRISRTSVIVFDVIVIIQRRTDKSEREWKKRRERTVASRSFFILYPASRRSRSCEHEFRYRAFHDVAPHRVQLSNFRWQPYASSDRERKRRSLLRAAIFHRTSAITPAPSIKYLELPALPVPRQSASGNNRQFILKRAQTVKGEWRSRADYTLRKN